MFGIHRKLCYKFFPDQASNTPGIETDPVSTIQFLKVTALQYNVWNEDAFITSHTVTYRFIRKSVPKELLYRFFFITQPPCSRKPKPTVSQKYSQLLLTQRCLLYLLLLRTFPDSSQSFISFNCCNKSYYVYY